MNIVNIAAYKFVELPDPAAWREPLRARCNALALKGTILLTPEGINLFVAGTRDAIDTFLTELRTDALYEGRFADLVVKESLSADQPFRRMLVKIKKEIITMRHPTIRPMAQRAAAVEPKTLARWLDAGQDDAGRKLVLLDTRNAFEIELGSFDGAMDLGIGNFGAFPDAVGKVADQLRDKTVVTFCTGGIRCEKAALYMQELDLPHVVQLDGGILRYFEDVGGAHWHGECFVFDDRVAVDPQLRETATVQCYACRAVVTPMEQRDARYVPRVSCPHCAASGQSAARSADQNADRSANQDVGELAG